MIFRKNKKKIYIAAMKAAIKIKKIINVVGRLLAATKIKKNKKV